MNINENLPIKSPLPIARNTKQNMKIILNPSNLRAFVSPWEKTQFIRKNNYTVCSRKSPKPEHEDKINTTPNLRVSVPPWEKTHTNLSAKINYTDKLKSLSASFRLVFKSVLSFLFPIINAQPTPNVPAGNSLL